jgi:hypothetical protein
MMYMRSIKLSFFLVSLFLLASPAVFAQTSDKAPGCGKKAARPVTAKPDTGAFEVTAWPGRTFVILEKPMLYCGYGYELWSCPELERCRGPVDTALFTKYCRARCDVFAGRIVTAVSVTRGGAEYLVAFRDPVSGKKLYAKTAAGECHELAYAADRDSAEKRWLGKAVFSARGFVSDFSNGKSTTVKVDLRDPLRVTGVRFGLTPLPAKPLWLIVENGKGVKGAIPVRWSWTNVKQTLRHDGNPWDDEIHETSPSAVCTADGFTWEAINAHHVNTGMTRQQVRLSWGRPAAKDSADYNGARLERWTYESQNLYFDEKGLAGAEEKGK